MGSFLLIGLFVSTYNIITQEVPFALYQEQLSGSNEQFKMIPIRGGTFKMGSPKNEKGRKNDEGPLISVRVNDFWMAELEITWDIYELFLNRQIDHIEGPKGKIKLDIDGVSGATSPYVNNNKKGFPMINLTQ